MSYGESPLEFTRYDTVKGNEFGESISGENLLFFVLESQFVDIREFL